MNNKNKILHIVLALLQIIMILVTALGLLLLLAQKWMLATWAHLTMEELLFQLNAGVQGASPEYMGEFLYQCAFPAGALLLGLVAAWLLLARKPHYRWILAVAGLLFGLIASYYSVRHVYDSLDVEEYIESQSTDSMFITEHYVDPATVNITFPEKKRNLICIFLESMESTYSSKEFGGAYDVNYIKELTDLALSDGSICFSNSDQLGGAYTTVASTFTMGGLFAQTSGLPLKISIQGNEMAYQDSFFPSLTCLGDILAQNGYEQCFLMGSDGTFGGRSLYFQTHGNYEIRDYYWAVEQGLLPEGYFKWWGFEDAKLFEYAKDKLTEMGSSDTPFNFSMLTVATHFEDGYLCEQCGNEFDDHYGNVIACSSARVVEFVNWIREQEWYDNTTVIITGDHLTMDSDFCENISEDYQRSTYDCILNAAAQPVNEKNRAFTTLDMFPTTLGALGCTIDGNRLALGTNLFSDQQTLTEEMGFEAFNEELKKRSDFFVNLEKETQLVKTWVGNKYYITEDDRYAVDEWVLHDPHQVWCEGEQYYYQGQDGESLTGWQKIGGYWYFFGDAPATLRRGPYLQPTD